MKFIGICSAVGLASLAMVTPSEAINSNYKQGGSEVDRSKQIKKPSRQHGTAIIKQFESSDEVSFKVGSKDNARIVLSSDNDDLDYSISEPGKTSFKKLDKLMEEGNPGAKQKEKS